MDSKALGGPAVAFTTLYMNHFFTMLASYLEYVLPGPGPHRACP